MSEYGIIPVGSFDSSGAEKHTILVTGWVLDARLDPSKLEAAWRDLSIAWPILSARIRKDSKDNWFFHIPTSETPDYDFRVVHKSEPIRTSYTYSQPAPHIRLVVKENPDDLYSSPDPWRRKLPELMKVDKPISQLSLTLYPDASVLGLSVPHVLCDGMGVAEIMRALTTVLRGEPAPPIAPPDCDPFAKYRPEEDPKQDQGIAKAKQGNVGVIPDGWRVFSALQMAVFVFCTVWDMISRREDENREMYIPPQEVQRLKTEAMEDIKREGVEGEYISTSDAVLAFMLKCIYTPRFASSKHSHSLFYSANMRNHLQAAFPEDGAYIRNAARGALFTMPVASIPTESLGALALKFRRGLLAQTTPAYTESFLRFRMRAHAEGTTPVFFADPRSYWNVVTNWRTQRLMFVDLSPAAENAGAKVSVLYVWGTGYQPFPMRNDPAGGLWVGGFFPRAVWEDREGFGKYLEK
ncbi:hypothetical protein PUNSTDRAFT_54705 [Punctularia strigosozonata HHB-11173 SS5]|uniref:uncharacterized protein n=1 Tax=Punctularia strigosozonata (strain HHB-11173) TaxID=741275 RepID=UPI000441671C|nr:uncharacterized protein PUNSTDRAFT_54705 [Punctularia strigosozonata HHB-11173 SS5]EIN05849.1 hypothetical protein PUNSTDRAFT_54705 [Punctularia strigosozonata HHB-11173 SS5]